MIDQNACPICLMHMPEPGQPAPDAKTFWCPRCGKFTLTGTAEKSLRHLLGDDPIARAVLSHAIRRMQRSEGPAPVIDSDLGKQIISSTSLPNPAVQADHLIRWFGDSLVVPGRRVKIDPRPLIAEIGAVDERGFTFILNELTARHFVEWTPGGPGEGALTFDGWQRYEELKKGESTSRNGFMAMDFKNEVLTHIFLEHLKPASRAAGFELVRLDENPPAGLIDARLQNEIRNARFLVADLTNRNPGAYWEAGFAEGLGKPVIYMCESSVFEAKSTHFDTNHFHTIPWESANPKIAAEKLKNTIRATLPAEAKPHDV
jgi:hypothetical protein